MDPQQMAQINQSLEETNRSLAFHTTLTTSLVIVVGCLAAWMIAWMIVSLWWREQRYQAECRVRDRLAQAEDPEGWARHQARRAHEAALVAEELAAMRRARWYGRLLTRWRHDDQVPG
jgi:hypothetical protein